MKKLHTNLLKSLICLTLQSDCLCFSPHICSTRSGFCCFPVWLILHLPYISFSTRSSSPVSLSYSHLCLVSWIKPQLYSLLLFQTPDFCIPPFQSLPLLLIESSFPFPEVSSPLFTSQAPSVLLHLLPSTFISFFIIPHSMHPTEMFFYFVLPGAADKARMQMEVMKLEMLPTAHSPYHWLLGSLYSIKHKTENSPPVTYAGRGENILGG